MYTHAERERQAQRTERYDTSRGGHENAKNKGGTVSLTFLGCRCLLGCVGALCWLFPDLSAIGEVAGVYADFVEDF